MLRGEQRNVNPTGAMPSVDRDRNFEIRYCSPKQKTKSFALTEPDNTMPTFDAAENVMRWRTDDFLSQLTPVPLSQVIVEGAQNGQ